MWVSFPISLSPLLLNMLIRVLREKTLIMVVGMMLITAVSLKSVSALYSDILPRVIPWLIWKGPEGRKYINCEHVFVTY